MEKGDLRLWSRGGALQNREPPLRGDYQSWAAWGGTRRERGAGPGWVGRAEGGGTLGDYRVSGWWRTNMALWVRSGVRAVRLWGRGGEPAWACSHRFVRVAVAGRATGGRAETGRLGVALVARGRGESPEWVQSPAGQLSDAPRLVHVETGEPGLCCLFPARFSILFAVSRVQC